MPFVPFINQDQIANPPIMSPSKWLNLGGMTPEPKAGIFQDGKDPMMAKKILFTDAEIKENK